MFYVRVALLIIWVVIFSILGVMWAVVRFGSYNINHQLGHFFSFVARPLVGVTLEVQGAEHLETHQPCVYITNHQSMYDVVPSGGVMPSRTVSIGKKEAIWIPAFGLVYVAARNILVDRGNRTRAIATLSRAARLMREKNVSIWFYVEGTRNRAGRGLLPFKKGAFHLAVEGRVPIVPIVVAELWPLVNWKERRMLGGNIQVRVLPPISTEGKTMKDIDALVAEAHAKMLEALGEIRSQPRA